MSEPADDRLTPEDSEDSRITQPSLPPFPCAPANDSDPPPPVISARGDRLVDRVVVAWAEHPELRRKIGQGIVGFLAVLSQCVAWIVLADILGAAWYYGRTEGVVGLAVVACSGGAIAWFWTSVGFMWGRAK